MLMWTKEKVKEEAAKLTTTGEWRANKALSSAASRLGIYKEVTQHLIKERKEYSKNITKEEIFLIASYFNTRLEFQKAHPSLYK